MLEIINTYTNSPQAPQDILSEAASISGIISLIVALVVAAVGFFYWRYIYRKQRSSDKALAILDKVKLFYADIVYFRAPRFRNYSDLEEYTNNIRHEVYKLTKSVISINRELINSKYYLIKNKNLLNDFKEIIQDPILAELRTKSELLFNYVNSHQSDEMKSKIEKLRLFFNPDTQYKSVPVEVGNDYEDEPFSILMKAKFKEIEECIRRDIIVQSEWLVLKQYLLNKLNPITTLLMRLRNKRV